jgi:hypothetical protein
MGHERRIRANGPAAGRPQTADPAGGKDGFRLGPDCYGLIVRRDGGTVPDAQMLKEKAMPPRFSPATW